MNQYDAIVIGGGFFGINLAIRLRTEHRQKVLLLEAEDELMSRASYNNQARVHGGYHYPRSLTTGLRSRASYRRFIADFSQGNRAIEQKFKKYYAVARRGSQVTAAQFSQFCETIGAPIRPAPAALRATYDPNLIEDIFEVEECAFNAVELRKTLSRVLAEQAVEVRIKTRVNRVSSQGSGGVLVETQDGTRELAKQAFICTYSQINQLLHRSSLPFIGLRHELTEIALVKPPKFLSEAGLTVMCGEFFSMMPFPAANLYSFSHVRYTPHFSWSEHPNEPLPSVSETDPKLTGFRSRYMFMYKDAQRFFPGMEETEYVKSLYEVKTILPRNDENDGRPILFKTHHGMPGLHCVLGGKIDNIYDAFDELQTLLGKER